MCEIVKHKVAALLKTSVPVKIRVARSGWQRDPCGWNERGGVASILGRDVWFDGETTISRVSLPMTSVCEGWTTGWLSCPQCHKPFQIVQDFPASICLVYDGICQQQKKLGQLCSDYETKWEGEWNSGKARDHFHKVPCVRLPDQAKRNITSIALIKAQPKWWKNNDVRATALLRTDRKNAGASNHSTL